MDRHCQNAAVVASFLERHPRVERVLYPGLPTHPGHEIAARQMRDFGGMVSFLLEDEQEAVDLVARTRIWKLAEAYDRAAPYWHHFRGIERYWRKRREAAANT